MPPPPIRGHAAISLIRLRFTLLPPSAACTPDRRERRRASPGTVVEAGPITLLELRNALAA
eukprot:8428298-Alexandrium_andersonii.AAC.1